jgi:hypothetical protein
LYGLYYFPDAQCDTSAENLYKAGEKDVLSSDQMKNQLGYFFMSPQGLS